MRGRQPKEGTLIYIDSYRLALAKGASPAEARAVAVGVAGQEMADAGRHEVARAGLPQAPKGRPRAGGKCGGWRLFDRRRKRYMRH